MDQIVSRRPRNTIFGVRLLGLFLASISAVLLFVSQSRFIIAQSKLPVSVTCNHVGSRCTLKAPGYGTIVENFGDRRAGSCQAAFDIIRHVTTFPRAEAPVWSLTCLGPVSPSGSSSGSSGHKAWSNNNCCYDYWQCRTDQEWQDGYWAFQNGQCEAGQTPAASPISPTASTPVDNCCFVDRQCASDQEWIDGYYAYQNGQCAADGQSQTPASSSASTLGASSSQIDNCCFVDRQCTTDHEWVDGYYAYQNGHCGPLS